MLSLTEESYGAIDDVMDSETESIVEIAKAWDDAVDNNEILTSLLTNASTFWPTLVLWFSLFSCKAPSLPLQCFCGAPGQVLSCRCFSRIYDY